jgi:hypothetical protein
MSPKRQLLFSKRNYWLLLVAVILIVSGYSFMNGTPNEGGTEFNTGIYSWRRITLSPFLLLTGYAVVAVSIMVNPKKHSDE